jgi:tetratricopeptide (TPR) repeat protein
MKRHIKTILIILSLMLSFVTGIIYGKATMKASIQDATQTGLSLIAEQVLVMEAEYAESIYENGSIEEKIKTLTHFIKILEWMGLGEPPIYQGNTIFLDLALNYTRLGLLYKKTDNLEKSDEFIRKAVKIYPQYGKGNIKSEEIIRLVQRINGASDTSDNSSD